MNPEQQIDVQRARKLLVRIQRAIRRRGGKRLEPLLLPVQAEIAVATAEGDLQPVQANGCDPLFPLHTKRWAVDDRDLFALIPVRNPHIRIIAFDFDVAAFMEIRTADKLLDDPVRVHSYLVAFSRSGGERREPLVVSKATAEFLECCNGTRSVTEIMAYSKYNCALSVKWLEEMFLSGLLSLQDQRIDPAVASGRRALKRIEVRSFCLPLEVL